MPPRSALSELCVGRAAASRRLDRVFSIVYGFFYEAIFISVNIIKLHAIADAFAYQFHNFSRLLGLRLVN